MIHPANIHEVPAYGTGNMGDVTDPTSTARFSLDVVRGFALKSFWVRAISGSNGTSRLNLWINHRLGSVYNWIPLTWEKFGLGAAADIETELFIRIPDENLGDFTCWRESSSSTIDEFCLEWSNPGNIAWSAGFRLVDIDRIGVLDDRLR